MPQQNDVIQVVLSVYDKSGTYSRYAGVVMTSLFSNTKSPVNVTILHDDTLTDDNRRRFERTGERFGQSVSFVDVGEHIYRISDDPDKIGHTRGSLFRLLIPELLAVPKVIYLDSDIVVNLDIAELWGVDIGDSALAGRPICARKISMSARAPRGEIALRIPHSLTFESERQRVFGFSLDTYINSGVLLMNLDKFRARYGNMLKESRDFFPLYGSLARWGDQDFLNVYCAGDLVYLDQRFNVYYYGTAGAENVIIHYGDKTWRHLPRTHYDYLWWKFFLASEWSDQTLDILVELGANDAFLSAGICGLGNPQFPFHRIPKGSKIILYGAGKVGQAWYKLLRMSDYCEVVLWVDQRADDYCCLPPPSPIVKPAAIKDSCFDYVAVAAGTPEVARSIRDDLTNDYGVDPARVISLWW